MTAFLKTLPVKSVEALLDQAAEPGLGRNPAIAAGLAALKALLVSHNDVATVAEALSADRTKTTDQRAAALSQHVRLKLAPRIKTAEGRLDELLTAAEEAQERALDRLQPRDAVQAALFAEVRTLVRSIPPEQRAKAVRSDPVFAQAVASASPLLSAVTDELHAGARRIAAEADPEASRHLIVADSAVALMAAGQNLVDMAKASLTQTELRGAPVLASGAAASAALAGPAAA